MFNLNVSLTLKREGEFARFLRFVKHSPGLQSGPSPPTFHSWDAERLVWVKLESHTLDAEALQDLLKNTGFTAYVYDADEHEPKGKSHDCHLSQ